jgi:hypothetical protein
MITNEKLVKELHLHAAFDPVYVKIGDTLYPIDKIYNESVEIPQQSPVGFRPIIIIDTGILNIK